MTEKDPIRLREDPEQSANVRELFEAARGERADEAMLQRVLAGVLATGGGGGGGGGSAPLAKSAALPALGVGAGVVTIVAIAIGTTLYSGSEPVHPSDAGVVIEAPIDAAVAIDAGSAVDAAVVEDASIVAVRPQTRPHVQPQPAPGDPREDLALMRRVAASLESDPARALALANEHRERFPDSVLAEEREADAILALVALHRDATARLATFRGRWPRSAHLRRIEAALAGAR